MFFDDENNHQIVFMEKTRNIGNSNISKEVRSYVREIS